MSDSTGLSLNLVFLACLLRGIEKKISGDVAARLFGARFDCNCETVGIGLFSACTFLFGEAIWSGYKKEICFCLCACSSFGIGLGS